MTFVEEHRPERAIVVSLDPAKRKLSTKNGSEILVWPYKDFLNTLWQKKII